eukprot:3978157-Prymnesium_polylepis.2
MAGVGGSIAGVSDRMAAGSSEQQLERAAWAGVRPGPWGLGGGRRHQGCLRLRGRCGDAAAHRAAARQSGASARPRRRAPNSMSTTAHAS